MRDKINQRNTAQLSDVSFLIICVFYFASFWVFSFWVLQNKGVYWVTPLALAHHPFDLKLLDIQFFQTITYLFMQSPLYSIVTWLMLKTGANDGFVGYMVLHYVLGFFALASLYKICVYLKINKWLITLSLSYFVFNPFFYLAFTSGWYDFLTMCLVSINVYCFMRLSENFTIKNLCFYIVITMLLVLYRSLYHPILFFIPVILLLLLSFRKHWRSILLVSLIPFVITLTPYLKNYYIFNLFDVAAGSFGLAMRASTYEYQSQDELIEEVAKGRVSPLVLCYKQILQPLVYQGVLYTTENCYSSIIPRFASVKVNELKAKQPQLLTPLVLQDKYNAGFKDNYLPNNLIGLVIAKQMSDDAKNYLMHHPGQYVKSIQNNLTQLFRSNNTYIYLIANNSRNYPLWFGSRWLSFDIFKYHTPAPTNFGPFDIGYRPQILIGLLCSFVFAFLYAANIQHRNLFSFVHFIGALIILTPMMFGDFLFNLLNKRVNWYMDIAIIWSLLFVLPAMVKIIKFLIFSSLKQETSHLINREFIIYVLFICLYTIGLVVMIPGSEQERYRFIVEGLLIGLFLFWISNLFDFIKSFFSSNPAGIKKRDSG